MLRISASQFEAGRRAQIEAFLARTHEHQLRVGIVPRETALVDRLPALRSSVEHAFAFGFTQEAYLMFVMDCIERAGPARVGAILDRAHGPEPMRARHLLGALS